VCEECRRLGLPKDVVVHPLERVENPAIVVTLRVSGMQRVVLLSYNKEQNTISFRHYSVSLAPSGLTKGVKALLHKNNVPDLSHFSSVSEFVEKAGYGSESEGEEAAAARVSIGSVHGGNAAKRSRVRLHEVRPSPTVCNASGGAHRCADKCCTSSLQSFHDLLRGLRSSPGHAGSIFAAIAR
jgi:ribosome biogenesis protein SSF1/2